MAKCYAVASGKGGVGKSTITANLAAALSSQGNRVIVIDADIGLRSLDALLSLENRVVYDIIDLLNGECTLPEALLQTETYPSLHLLAAAQFARAKELDPKRFRKLIDSLQSMSDYIFIDCPAGVERGFRNVINTGVDEIILVVTPDDISLRSAEKAAQVIGAKSMIRPFLIVNRLQNDLIQRNEMMSARTVADTLDLPLLGEIPEDPVVYRSVYQHALFIRFVSEARDAVFRISYRVQGKSIAFPAYGTQKIPLFRRLFGNALKEVKPIDDH